jgi:two-component system CheB/CheR fusion protein
MNPSKPEETRFPVVGIGASAGGLDAFKRFFKALPRRSGMAFVVVQHLHPSHQSFLPEILSQATGIPVVEITDDIVLKPDHIYVIPSNKTLTTYDGVLKLKPRTKSNPGYLIDLFFESLAEVHQSYAVGIILSGAGSDGTLGLKAIKAAGGITFAQDDQSSQYKSMPSSAVLADVVDFVLPPEKIALRLLQINYNNRFYTSDEIVLSAGDEEVLGQILTVIRLKSGLDFTHYKQTTIRRRLARRMALAKKERLKDYLKFLKSHPTEETALFHDLLIPVTSFFRDPKVFEALKESIFPRIVKNKPEGEPIRIWSAGCSTGEEAYSLAMSIHEFLVSQSIKKQIQVFGSDVSETAISKARSGIYSSSEVGNIPDSFLDSYFVKSGTDFRVGRQIRDMCVFAVHNFLKDPPFVKMDLISCRNVLIYMDLSFQKRALTTFHYSLKENGFLLLGKSETAGTEPDLFEVVEKPEKIYAPKAGIGRTSIQKISYKDSGFSVKKNKTAEKEKPVPDYIRRAHDILISEYTPANLIVNEHLEVQYMNGPVGEFLVYPKGKPTFNLIKMTGSSLAFELRNLVHQAKSSNSAVIREGIPDEKRKKFTISTEVLPIKDADGVYFLIIFRKTPIEKILNKTYKMKIGEVQEMDHERASLRIIELETELAQARKDMLAITEDQENVNQQLQTANEELLSGSEELQSLNEELETTKEEVQSSNEELIIVNQALIEKQEQLNLSRLYAEAIIQTLREPFVVMDKDLRIKTADRSFYTKFNTSPGETEGKFFYEILDQKWENPLLRTMLDNILLKKIKLDDFEVVLNIPPLGECVMLLNARQIISDDLSEPMILLAIEDITERKILERQRKVFSEELEAKVKERTSALQQANLQLEQFSHTASHEFQEPLRKIVTFSSHLQKSLSRELTPEVSIFLNKIEKASVRMSKLISDMLNFSSIANHESLVKKTDLSVIIRDVLFDFELLIEEKKAVVTFDDLPEIEAVPFQMNQLFYDLIHNSLKFSKTEVPPQIHISSRKLTAVEMQAHPKLYANLTYYDIIFEDNGIGFNQKYAKQIFTMFQRLNEGSKYSGTGIGLALCKKIVQNYCGEIYAEGEENKGARFHVILPVKQPKDVKKSRL